MEKVMLVGLCGGSGSGKGYVSAVFRKFGIPSIDTDAVYRNLTSPAEKPSECMEALRSRFGASVVADDNSLNRVAMRSLVFGEENRHNLDDLNKITHRFILQKTNDIANELFSDGYDVVLIDAPLLYESGFDKLCVKNICVTADKETRIQRIMKRDNITREAAEKRINSQLSQSDVEKRSDYVIHNDTTDEELEKRIFEVADELKRYITNN